MTGDGAARCRHFRALPARFYDFSLRNLMRIIVFLPMAFVSALRCVIFLQSVSAVRLRCKDLLGNRYKTSAAGAPEDHRQGQGAEKT